MILKNFDTILFLFPYRYLVSYQAPVLNPELDITDNPIGMTI